MKLKRSHVMKPIRQLYQNDPNIVRHGKDHLSDTLCLTFLGAVKGKFAQLGNPGYNMRNFLTEHILNLIQSRVGIFYYVM